jgi:hypothetical protein
MTVSTATGSGIQIWGRVLEPERLVWWTIAATLLVKLALALAIPVIQDEAYFSMWGENPSLGYAEHPPMIGWIESILLLVGRSPLIIRLPAILGPLTIGLGLFWVLKEFDRRRAALASVLFLVSPLNLVNVLVTTDSALVFFSFWSAACLFKGLRSERLPWFAAAGGLLGMAFLSKYFSALLALAYGVYFLAYGRSRKKALGFLLLFACAIPAGLLTLYWNYTHAWLTVRYPFFRNDRAQFSILRAASFLAIQLYFLIPAGLFDLARGYKTLVQRIRSSPIRLFGLLYAVPIAVLAVLSVRKVIGVHWVLSFYPFVYAVSCLMLDPVQLRRSIRVAGVFSGVHVLVIAAVLSIPLSWIEEHAEYNTAIMALRPEKIVAELRTYADDHRFAAPGFGVAGMMDLRFPERHVAAWGRGSHHGRADDLITDFREWHGDDVVIFQRDPPDLAEFEPYFAEVSMRTLEIERAKFYLVIGRGFDFPAYRDGVLSQIRERFYNVPGWLPVASDYYGERYFEGRP